MIAFRKTLAWGLLLTLAVACAPEDDDTVDFRDDFTGSWTCQETQGDFAPQSYAVSVSKVGDENEISIRGLYNQGSTFEVSAQVDGPDFTIPTQSVDGFVLSGGGSVNNSGSIVYLNFAINDGGSTDNVSANWTR